MASNNMMIEFEASQERERQQSQDARIAAIRARMAQRDADENGASEGEPVNRNIGPMEALGRMTGQAREGLGNVGAVASDVVYGVAVESPGAVGHGVIDGINSTIGLVDELGAAAANTLTGGINPRLRFENPETGEFDPGIIWTEQGADEFRRVLAGRVGQEQADRAGRLPEVPQVAPEQDTVTGNLIEGISQFMTGFLTGGAALKSAGWARATPGAVNWTRSMVQGAIADFTAFEANEGRMMDLLGDHAPEAVQPFVEFMQTNEEDGELLGRFKTSLEGAGLGVLADTLMVGARGLHRSRQTSNQLRQVEEVMNLEDAAAAEAFERDIIQIGDPNGPLIKVGATPGRMTERMLDQAIADLQAGNRGLDRLEQEHLLGAAERWAEAAGRIQPNQAAGINRLIDDARSRLNEGDVQGVIDMLNEARRPTSQAVSLMDWLRSQGGLVEDSGELAALGGQPMRLRNGQPVSTNKGGQIINENGMTLDRAAEAAAEAGYIGRRTIEDGLAGFEAGDPNDLLDALRREMGGDAVYSEFDYEQVFADAARMDLLDEIERLGLDPSAPVRERTAQAERLARWEPGEPLTLRDVERIEADMNEAGASLGVEAPASSLLGGEQTNINFNALNTPDDIRSIIGQLADADADNVNAARRLGRADDEVLTEANAINAWNALQERRVGEPLTDAQVRAAQRLYISSAENVRQAIEVAASSPSVEAQYQVRRALSVHSAIQAEIAGAKADAARALRAWGIPTSANAASRRHIQEVLQQHGGAFSAADLARLRQLADDPSALDKLARNGGGSIGADVLRMAWLSGPKTHIANMAGNTLTILHDTLPRLTAGIKGKILGDPVLERQLGVAMAEYTGLMVGIRAQLSAFARSADYGRMGRNLQEIAQNARNGAGLRETLMNTGSTLVADNPVSATFRGRFDDMGVGGRKYNDSGPNRSVSAERFGVAQDTAQGRMLDGIGAVLSAPTEFLGFQDDFFKGVNALATRYRAGYEQALSELGEGASRQDIQRRMTELVAEPTQAILDESTRVAQRRTFTEPVGKYTNMFVQGRDALKFMGIPFGHVLLPFIVTPSNILKYAAMNSPVGYLFREVRDDIAAGGARREMAHARISLGTGMLMLGIDMAANGDITGRSPTDPAERQALQRAGWQEYSIRIDGKYYSFRRLEPVSTMLSMGADLHQIISRADDDPVAAEDGMDAVMGVVGSMLNAVTSKTYLTGVSEFIQFTEDPEMRGAEYGRRLLSGIAVPAGVSEIERVVDPEIREARALIDRVMARIPGMSESLPQQHDLWGRPRIFDSGNGQVYDALAPWTARRIDPEPIDAELIRLNDFPAMPSPRITYRTREGVSAQIDLRQNPALFQQYVRRAGNDAAIMDGMGARELLNAIVQGEHRLSSAYESLPDWAPEGERSKGTMIRDIINAGRQRARAELRDEFNDELARMAQQALTAQESAMRRREETPLLPE